MALHENLRRLRNMRGLKQAVLAQVCGTSQQTYSKYETGELPVSAELVALIAAFYGISVAEIYGLPETGPPKVLDAKHQELYDKLLEAQNTIIALQQESLKNKGKRS